MKNFLLTDDDKKQIQMFKNGVKYVNLHDACSVGNGINIISSDDYSELLGYFEKAILEKELLLFIPASGAASRMFKVLVSYNNKYDHIDRDLIRLNDNDNDNDKEVLLEFIDNIYKFAFCDDLKSVMDKKGLNLDHLIENGQFKSIIDYLVSERGLSYSNIPKGLLKFHKCNGKETTALEDHLSEAACYLKDKNNNCNIHLTVSSEHKQAFEKHIKNYESRCNIHYNLSISVQKNSTDTLAVDLNDVPYRINSGEILFRPGGHGALLENLNDVCGDIVFIKNVDNVVPEANNKENCLWKKLLCGYFLQIQEKLFYYLKRLVNGNFDEKFVDNAMIFAKEKLNIVVQKDSSNLTCQQKKDFLIKMFNRPVRVCGMVKNEGEPGGGPYWVKSTDNRQISIQIVEKEQVDAKSEQQQSIQRLSTHFNPVDIVCGLRDYKGNQFELTRFIDPETFLITTKSIQGEAIKVLEHPGLWNGSMADWITILIEVPNSTFNPVKTVNDLLCKKHIIN